MASVAPASCPEHICYYCGDGYILPPICRSCGRDFRCSECGESPAHSGRRDAAISAEPQELD